ncbi:glycoside hydrolase family 5 protein [Phenylobacterium deserti]|nr:glycoside hydrolase family 5 protein [Phenylobacterium deserti]
MRKRWMSTAATLLALVLSLPAAAQPADGYKPAAAAKARTGPTLPVGKCINLSNTLETPKEGEWGRPFRDDDFRIMKAAGFSTVRIPVKWSAQAQERAPYTINPAALRRVHRAVDLANAAGLNVILNVHHYDELTSDPDTHAQRLAGLWRQIGENFKDAPPNVWFELLNEPHSKLDDSNLPGVWGAALAAVRASNPTRPVLVGGQNWSNLASLSTMKLPDDPYVVPTFHYYEPFDFTHQGAHWTSNPPPWGRTYGSEADKALLARDLQTVKAYMARSGRVPILGEYGAMDDPRVPVKERAEYYHAVSSAFASIGVPSCAWGYYSGFRLRDDKGWIPGLLEVIASPRP